uniref:Nudix hydrolase domain-containing protein n=1 Tax=Kwoniella dejecticola CBS 10117 TaxID=1296121 RepID=A0A1A6ABQ9_9TREE|nr:uncharacterized protein I303_01708 [Kwoniella dejecticola CBS 10117]OBR87501.1 hypothetical protein I303_01708 [Kwoniella dejecticola CBS 10117]
MTLPLLPDGKPATNGPEANTHDVLAHIPPSALEGLSEESINCLRNLASFETPPLVDLGLVKQAAVLVALFQKDGDDKLHVLLTTRAKTMRRHPSQTALPGGKVDPEDPDVTYTARREAFEEVGLPLDHPSIHPLTILEQVMTILPLNSHMKNHIVVTPVVCFISDTSLLKDLVPNPDEVDAIFTHPLKGCLTGTLDEKDSLGLVDVGGEWWPHEEEYHSTNDRVGRFRTTNSPIKGLTSDVLIQTAMIAYGTPTTYTRFALNQSPFSTLISGVVRDLPFYMDKSTNSGPVEWGGTEGERYKSSETWAAGQ